MQLIGCFLSLILYGTLCDQVYIYYISFPKDNLASKTVVYLLWLAETVQTATNIHYTFDTFCYDFGNLSGLDDVHLAWFIIPILSGFVGCIAQLFYAWRMYKFSKKARWLCITLSVVRVLKNVLCCSLKTISSSKIAFAQFAAAISGRHSFSYLIIYDSQIWLGASALCDTAIALCMTYVLSRNQTGLKSTRILLSRLIRLTIETGTVTAVIAAIDMALFLAYPNNNYHAVPANCLVKIYSNAVLAVCNSRMTRRIRGGREETAFHSFESFDLSIGGLNIEFQDTEINANADSSLRPAECPQGSESEGTLRRFFWTVAQRRTC
ncbi:hypothetical protein ARMGADRAFT_1103488 [Armillaria gallica]|uniref:DUF6534 domain-containing protein n=1 Tax=Armillaria gallica TaxID=47427 RepID=A0A2H3DAZ9_ARMGA|nr:hypothetical protein ARMGADRAFT_1103488 [Armillaria gallica]